MGSNGEAKDTVEQVQDLNEAKAVIAEAGMLLSDDEASAVAGGEGEVFACPYCPARFTSQAECEYHQSLHRRLNNGSYDKLRTDLVFDPVRIRSPHG